MLEVQFGQDIAKYQKLAQKRARLQQQLTSTDKELLEVWPAARAEIERQARQRLSETNSGICAADHIAPLADLRLHYLRVSQNFRGGEPYMEFLKRYCLDHYPNPADSGQCDGLAYARVVEIIDGKLVACDGLIVSPRPIKVEQVISPTIYRQLNLPVLKEPKNLYF